MEVAAVGPVLLQEDMVEHLITTSISGPHAELTQTEQQTINGKYQKSCKSSWP